MSYSLNFCCTLLALFGAASPAMSAVQDATPNRSDTV